MSGRDHSAWSFYSDGKDYFVEEDHLRNHMDSAEPNCERESLSWILITEYLLVDSNSTTSKAEICSAQEAIRTVKQYGERYSSENRLLGRDPFSKFLAVKNRKGKINWEGLGLKIQGLYPFFPSAVYLVTSILTINATVL